MIFQSLGLLRLKVFWLPTCLPDVTLPYICRNSRNSVVLLSNMGKYPWPSLRLPFRKWGLYSFSRLSLETLTIPAPPFELVEHNLADIEALGFRNDLHVVHSPLVSVFHSCSSISHDVASRFDEL